MAQVSLVYADLSTYTFSVSGAGTNSEYPLSNLTDYLREPIWQSDAITPNQSLIIDFGAAKTVDTLIMDKHNCDVILEVAAEIFLVGADDAAFTVNPVTAHEVSTTSDAIYVGQFDAQTKRYWRIFYKCNPVIPLADYPSIGNIYLESKLAFPYTYDFNYQRDNAQFETTENMVLDGRLKNVSIHPARIICNFQFQMITDAFRTSYKTFVNTVRGSMLPFYLIDLDSSIKYGYLMDDYNPVEPVRYNLNSINSFNFETQEVEDYYAVSPFVTQIEETTDYLI